MPSTKIISLGLYQGPNVISIDAAIDRASSLTLPSDDDVECLKVILNIINNYGELPCRLCKFSSIAIQSPTSLASISQEFSKLTFSPPEYEEIKIKFQNTFNALIHECNEILGITIQSAITLNTELYKFIQASSHDTLTKNIEQLSRTNLIGEVASKFINILTEIMTTEEEDLCEKGQKTFEQIRSFEPQCNNIVIEFAQIQLLVELHKKSVEFWHQVLVCKYVKSGAFAEETHQMKHT